VRIAFLAFLLHSSSLAAPLLNGPPPARIDERYRLNIEQRRWSQPHFRAGTLLEIGTPGGVHCKAGVSLRTGPIDVNLQGVRGDVRFLADPSRLNALFRNR
jgi:hypothetical protein